MTWRDLPYDSAGDKIIGETLGCPPEVQPSFMRKLGRDQAKKLWASRFVRLDAEVVSQTAPGSLIPAARLAQTRGLLACYDIFGPIISDEADLLRCRLLG